MLGEQRRHHRPRASHSALRCDARPWRRDILPPGRGCCFTVSCRFVSESRHEPAVTLSRRLDGGTVIGAHSHDENQVVYASGGVLSVATDAGAWVAPASRAIWIPAGVTHQHRAYGPTVLHTIGLPAAANPLRITEPAVLAVSPLLAELFIAYTEDPADRGPERRRLRAVMLDRLRASPQQPLRLPAGKDPRLRAVCDLLRADPADPRGLGRLGAAAGVSQRTLTRLFREEMGMTFPQWRTQLRLHLALRLLADGLPVTVVGRRCGWATTSAFIDAFRRTLGHTPGRSPRSL
jgi:AraC-like DNA-binding protein